ncbi:MAG: zinc-dependent peptidase [Niastella sp.]|nr:zinc-dependent peptidase [Niastella sp.]
METIIGIAGIAIMAVLLSLAFRKKKALPTLASDTIQPLLQEHVAFYRALNVEQKAQFEKRVIGFLEKVHITGVNTTVEDIDRALVAAGAIIPIFSFPDWEYRNIHEVLLYPGSFDDEFKQDTSDRNILGMVGTGPMQNVMILSQQNVRDGFRNTPDKHNTAIHEFVHLVDKADGSTDGLPEALIPHQYARPWLKRIHEEMQLIREGRSDINYYGTTNEAEFLAVVSEYFFEKPAEMEKKHPELYDLLKRIFLPPA